MMRHLWQTLVGITLLLPALSARAEDGPVLAPPHDVAVVYKLTGASQQQGATKLQVTYADRGRVRLDFFRYVEAKYPFGSLIFDPPADRVITVVPERQGYVERDVGKLPSPGSFLNAKMNFTRQGKAMIAGMQCTDWHVFNGTAGEGTACVTDDGVVLRATRDKPVEGSMEATAVQYGSPPPEIFAPPPGLKLLAPVQQGTPPRPPR
jgi:hypothetical protein